MGAVTACLSGSGGGSAAAATGAIGCAGLPNQVFTADIAIIDTSYAENVLKRLMKCLNPGGFYTNSVRT